MKSREDLLDLLDLEGKEAATAQNSGLAITPAETRETPADLLSPTALHLDAWGLRRGKEVLQESERVRATGLDEDAVADMHGAAFEPDPQLTAGCVDPRRHDFLSQLLQTPDYQALHQSTMLGPTASGIAACAFAEQFAALRKEENQKEGSGHAGKGGTAGKGEGALDREMAALRAAGRAVAEAGKEVGECKEAAAALGLGPGSPGSNDPHAVAALFRRVRDSPALRRICGAIRSSETAL